MQAAFAGVDIGGTRIKIGVAARSGQLLGTTMLETSGCPNAETILDAVVAKVADLATASSVQIVAVGVGCPGRIDFTLGKVVWLKSKLEFLEGIDLARLIEARLGCPVVCDNDVNAILAGEMKFGAGRGYQDVVAITVGTGIGGALVLGGNMVRGHGWAAGHFGYMSHNAHGPRHVCGNTGIVEEHASQSGISRQLRAALAEGEVSSLTKSLADGEGPGLREVFEAAEASDPLGRRLAERLTFELGVLIANLIYAFDPELILIGGGIVNNRPSVLDAIRREVTGRVDYLPEGSTEIQPMALGDAAGVLGGVALAMNFITQTDMGISTQGIEK